MNCKKPFFQGLLAFGCGQCMPCRLNRRRLWTHRLLLEQLKHGDSCFLTLTYDEKHLPEGGSLVPKHAQDFLKRLRSKTNLKLRYYLVGEYGEDTERPHYHVALFGYPNCVYGRSRYSRFEKKCCSACETIRSTWGKGNIFLGDLTKDSAQYVAGYVTKKMTSITDPRLKGRYPEFARMSRRPGIGATAMVDVADALSSEDGANELIKTGDVPAVLQHGKKKLPLGRYLRSQLRKAYGFEKTETPKEKIKEWSLQLSQLLEVALSSSKDPKVRYEEMRKVYIDDQKILNQTARNKIYSKKGSL